MIVEIKLRPFDQTAIAAHVAAESKLNTMFNQNAHTAFSGVAPERLSDVTAGITITVINNATKTISAEQIIDYDPQVILGPSSHGDQLTVEMIAAREGWTDMTAVQNEAIFLVDGDIVSHTGPRIVDALDLIAAALYPGYFGD